MLNCLPYAVVKCSYYCIILVKAEFTETELKYKKKIMHENCYQSFLHFMNNENMYDNQLSL